MKIYRPGRCGVCGKPASDEVHEVVRMPPLCKRLLTIAWPRWTWGSPRGAHAYVERDILVRIQEETAAMRRRLERLKRQVAAGRTR